MRERILVVVAQALYVVRGKWCGSLFWSAVVKCSATEGGKVKIVEIMVT